MYLGVYTTPRNGTHGVANLIMIGTPNAGSPLVQSGNICAPARYDLKPGAPDTLGKNESKY